MERCNGDALASDVVFLRPGLLEAPVIASTSIKEDGDEEEINQPSGDLGHVLAAIVGPSSNQRLHSRDITNVKVLPATVGRDRVELVGAKVALRGAVRAVGEEAAASLTLMTPMTKSDTSPMREGS